MSNWKIGDKKTIAGKIYEVVSLEEKITPQGKRYTQANFKNVSKKGATLK